MNAKQKKGSRNSVRTVAAHSAHAVCGTTYMPKPKMPGYSEAVREKAMRMYVESNNFWRLGRLLNVNHQSVVNCANAYQAI